jgi:hypothetical protein
MRRLAVLLWARLRVGCLGTLRRVLGLRSLRLSMLLRPCLGLGALFGAWLYLLLTRLHLRALGLRMLLLRARLHMLLLRWLLAPRLRGGVLLDCVLLGCTRLLLCAL